jgi:hypothetical protein
MNGELLRELALLTAGITASAAGAALLVIRVLFAPLQTGERTTADGADRRG